MNRLLNLFRKKTTAITVVSGLPRSGTSLMMKMLEVGGIPPLIDNVRTADEDNPKGYYEFERVKQLPKGDTEWLGDANGKVVKIISALLPHLPDSHSFKIIFMERNITEVLLSQKKMLVRRQEDPDKIDDEKLATLFKKHLQETQNWLNEHKHHISCLQVNYNRLLDGDKSILLSINKFLGGKLDTNAMSKVIDPSLYRSKK